MSELKTLRSPELLVILTPKNCACCGRDFGAVGREYKCPACRKPKERHRSRCRELSFREKQIARLLQDAKANKEIAFELSLTEGTIKEYLHHIFRKLGVKNRTELALWSQTNLAGLDETSRPHLRLVE